MSRTRHWARRAALSALAGGGLTGVGIGGALPGGALASDATTPSPTPPPPTSTSPVPAPEQSATTTTPAPGPAAPAPSSTTTTPTPPTSTQPASVPSHAPAPNAVGQHRQPSTVEPAVTVPAPVTPSPAPTAAPQQSSSEDIAPAPQLAAGQVTTPLFGGSLVSMQALGFYRIPLFLLPIYQAAGTQYGVPWQILAAINEVETDYGTDVAVSSAGAVGWMQFMPETWLQYGVDAVNAGYADPYNPVDAIFAAARYLHAAGASSDLHAAILAYNHSEAYVESVLLRARLIASYPASVIATLTGLTEGSLPAAGARVAPQTASTGASSATGEAAPVGSAAGPSPSAGSAQAASATPPGSAPAPALALNAARARKLADAPAPPSQLTNLQAAKNAPVVAVKDGRVVALGHSRKLGSYLVLRDTYGDVFTYAGMGEIAPTYPVAKPSQLSVPKGALKGGEAGADPKPSQAASSGQQGPLTLKVAAKRAAPNPAGARRVQAAQSPPVVDAPEGGSGKVRVFAHPGNPDALAAALAQAARTKTPPSGWSVLKSGALVAQGTVLGRVHPQGSSSSYGTLRFAIRPTGDQAAIDPGPVLENWRQLDAALHPQGAKGSGVLAGATASDAFLLGTGELERAVLSDPEIKLGPCERQQVAAGKADDRLLALLVFLSRSGLKPTVGEMRCGRLAYTASGPTARYLPGDALRITAINGVPVSGHQGAGTITDLTIRTLLTAKGRFAPKRIFSLMQYPGISITVAKPDHGDYIEIEMAPRPALRLGAGSQAGAFAKARAAPAPQAATPQLSSSQWRQLMVRIGTLPNPTVSRKPSSAAVRDAHR